MDLRIAPSPKVWCLSSVILGIVAAITSTPNPARAGVYIEPTELIVASEDDELTQRTGVLKSKSYAAESLLLTQNHRLDDLNSTQSVQIRQNGSPLVSIRGSNVNGRVLGMVDGFLLNTGDGLGLNRILIPTELLSDVSMVKTASSAAYGSDAMGGALRFRSRVLTRPTFRGGLASFGERSIFAGSPLFGKGKSNDFTQASYFVQDVDGGGEYHSAHSEQSGTFSRNEVRLRRGTATGRKLFGNWELQPQIIVAREEGSSPNSIVPGAKDGPSSFKNDAHLLGVGTSYQLNEKTTVGYRVQLVRSATDSMNDAYASFYNNHSQRLQQSLRGGIAATKDVQVEGFVDHVMDDYSESSPYTPTKSPLYTDFATDVGLKVGVALDDSWMIQPMARYLTRDGLAMGSFTFLKDIPELQMWASYNDGYRRAGLSDRFSNSGSYVGNPSLKPERSSVVEVGFLTKTSDPDRFWKSARYGFTVFQSTYKDLFQGAAYDATHSTKINLAEASTSGVEFQFEHSWNVWSFRLEVATLKTEDKKTNKRLVLSPENQISALLTHQLGPIVFELRSTQWGRYIDNYYDSVAGAVRTHEFDGWNKTDFSFRTLGLSDWSFRGGVENIFDTPRELTYGYPEALRRWFVSVERML